MTKDTEVFSHFTDSVVCREYTLPKDEKSSDPKGWIRGNTKTGPVLEVTKCCPPGKHGVEIRMESVNKDISHSWVKIYHGLNKLVTDLINREDNDDGLQRRRKYLRLQANPRLKQNQKKTFNCLFIFKDRTHLERIWIDIEPGAQFDQAYPVAKRIITLLRHGELLRD